MMTAFTGADPSRRNANSAPRYRPLTYRPDMRVRYREFTLLASGQQTEGGDVAPQRSPRSTIIIAAMVPSGDVRRPRDAGGRQR